MGKFLDTILKLGLGNELRRGQNRNPIPRMENLQVSIATDDRFCLRGECESEDEVVIRIAAMGVERCRGCLTD